MTDAPFVAGAYLVTVVALAAYARSLRTRLRRTPRLSNLNVDATDRRRGTPPASPIADSPPAARSGPW